MAVSGTAAPQERTTGVALYFVLACALSWSLSVPLMLAWGTHVTPPPYALPMMGFGAFGPLLAAWIVGARTHTLRDIFGHWRTNPAWIVVALFAPMAIHLPATVIEVMLGGRPAQWIYPPVKPEQVAALVVFSFGEEFGWRGLAYPRLAARMGAVRAALIVGVVWAIWHLGMKFTPENGTPDPLEFAIFIADLAVYSVVFAWVFERGNRSMAVALAFHAGGHLDNIYRAPDAEIRLRVLRFVVLVIVAVFAARSLSRKPAAEVAPTLT
jgi:membrane protease YdiL (CAAX protease family)